MNRELSIRVAKGVRNKLQRLVSIDFQHSWFNDADSPHANIRSPLFHQVRRNIRSKVTWAVWDEVMAKKTST